MSKKLLLADDSITIQKVIGITFAHEDYDLTVVGDGDAAFEKARADRPDLILADVFMPGKNGYDLCAAVKQDPALRNVPVLLLTGTFEPFDETKAASCGADSWIAKPFESQALIDRVEDLLARAVSTVPPVSSPAAGEDEDIWADLPGFAPAEEADMPAGLDEAFTPIEGFAVDGEQSSSPLLPEDDIWQSLGDELPSSGKGPDPFAFEESVDDLPGAAADDPFTEEPAIEPDPFIPEEEIRASAPDEDPWAAVAEEPAAQEGVWDAFDDDDILALDESDILEDDLDIPEDENLTAILASVKDEAEGEGPPIEDETDEDFPAAEIVWESDLEEVAEEEEFLSLGTEGLVPDAAADFMAAEDEDEDDVLELAEDLEEPEPSDEEANDSFLAEVEYAFSLEEAKAPVPPLCVAGGAEETSRSVPAHLVEEKVATLSDAEIERIVEKVAGSVIERLARTMLERIAWEVVPDLAESMIKEEIRKIREEVQ